MRSRALSAARSAERDALLFIDNLLATCIDTVPVQTAVRKALDHGFVFYARMRAALQLCLYGADARAALALLRPYGSETLNSAAAAIAARIERGTCIAQMLDEIGARARESAHEALAGSARASSMLWVAGAGSTLFLPVFAGMSLKLLSFSASALGAQGAVSPARFGAVLALFIIMLHLSGNRYGHAQRTLHRVSKTLVACSAGIVIMVATYLISAHMLG